MKYNWKIYVLFLALLFFSKETFGQISIMQFNADWNSSNTVEWLDDLSDVENIKYIDIAENPESQEKHEIIVVPTIIVFKDGDEVKRFQADISFSMQATKEDVQEVIDEQLMSDF